MRFDWDATKAEQNRKKHKVSFDEAVTVYADPLALTIPDEEHSRQEDRQRTTGRSSKDRVLLVVSTERSRPYGETMLRLITARRATPQEEQEYGEHIQQVLRGEA